MTFTEVLGEALYYSLSFSLIALVPTLLVILGMRSRTAARLGALLALWALYAVASAYVGVRVFLDAEWYPTVYLAVSLHPAAVALWLLLRLRRRRHVGLPA